MRNIIRHDLSFGDDCHSSEIYQSVKFRGHCVVDSILNKVVRFGQRNAMTFCKFIIYFKISYKQEALTSGVLPGTYSLQISR